MLLGEVEVVTPVDDPCQFAPDWRARVAAYIFSQGVRTEEDLTSLYKCGKIFDREHDNMPLDKSGKPKRNKGGRGKKNSRHKDGTPIPTIEIYPFTICQEYRQYALDEWIVKQVAFSNNETYGTVIVPEDRPLRLARKWFLDEGRGALKTRLEPLLLTEATMETITLDIAGTIDVMPAIVAYERLYFNCRMGDGSLHKSTQLLQSFATPNGELRTHIKKDEPEDADGRPLDKRPFATEVDIWKSMAVTLGYEALIRGGFKWFGHAHGLKDEKEAYNYMSELTWKVASCNLLNSIYTNNMRHEDVARVLGAYTAQTKMVMDSQKNVGGGGDDSVMALMAILKVAAPKMKEVVVGGAGTINDDAIRSRIESQRAIDAQVIDDKGKDVSDALIKEQIHAAVNGE